MREFKDQFATNCAGNSQNMDICPKDSSIIVAVLSIGTIIGSLLAAPAGDSLGRRKALVASVGVFCIGAIVQICAQTIPALLAGRSVLLAVFYTSSSSGIYQSILTHAQQIIGWRWSRSYFSARASIPV
jgi:MFS family permease